VDPVTINAIRYFNDDAARSLGVEMTVTKRTTRWLTGNASLELQRVTGTASNADAAYLAAQYEENYSANWDQYAEQRGPLLWDRPWAVNLNLDFSVFDKDRPVLFGWQLPPNWSLNLLARAEAGQRYTPYTWVQDSEDSPGEGVAGERYSETGPWRGTVNLRFSKYWKFGRNQKVTMHLEARNLFNHQNYRRVNPYTGEGYQLGDYNPDWVQRYSDPAGVEDRYVASTDSEGYAKGVVNPSYKENPRMFLWGVSYSW
jgi:hypothetical protein